MFNTIFWVFIALSLTIIGVSILMVAPLLAAAYVLVVIGSLKLMAYS